MSRAPIAERSLTRRAPVIGVKIGVGDISQTGSSARANTELDLFGGYCLSYVNRPPGNMQRGENTRVLIFTRLVDAWRRGLRDEATQLAGEIAVTVDGSKILTILTQLLAARGGAVLYGAADVAEQTIIGIGIRVALACLERGSADQLTPESERCIHQRLGALAPNVPVRIHTAQFLDEIPDMVRSGVCDDEQLLCFPPPIGLIPNQNQLCYASSVLTLILSITPVVKLLVDDGSPIARILLHYAWHLETGLYTHDSIADLHANLLAIPELSRFAKTEPDDAWTFAENLLLVLSRTRAAKLFSEIVKIPNLIDCGSITISRQNPSPAKGVFRKVSVGGNEAWTYDANAYATMVGPRELQMLVYRPREGGEIRTFEEIIHAQIQNRRPKVLLLGHDIMKNERPARLMPPCTLQFGDAAYSLHGSSLHYNVEPNGHYITMICSNTTTYFYDSQHDPDSEDLRLYRPRLICYVRID